MAWRRVSFTRDRSLADVVRGVRGFDQVRAVRNPTPRRAQHGFDIRCHAVTVSVSVMPGVCGFPNTRALARIRGTRGSVTR